MHIKDKKTLLSNLSKNVSCKINISVIGRLSVHFFPLLSTVKIVHVPFLQMLIIVISELSLLVTETASN